MARWTCVWAMVASLGGFTVATAAARCSRAQQPAGRHVTMLGGRIYLALGISIAKVGYLLFHCLRDQLPIRLA